MADPLEAIVQRMIDAGESEEDIAAVIQTHSRNKPGSGLNKPIKSPTTWGEGVMKSLTSGEAAMAGLKGAGGFLRGAIADIPASIYGAVDTFGKLPNPMTGGALNYHNRPTSQDELNEIWEGIKATPGHMADTTMKAGSNPHEFGRMVGQLTGQPLVTEGVGMIPSSAVTSAVRAVGKPVAAAGRFAKANTPLSSLMPRAASIPAAASVERAVGGGLTRIGESMQGMGSPKILRNSDYAPTPFQQPRNLPAPGGEMRGAMSAPETSITAPEMIPNSGYGPTNEFIDTTFAPTGPNKGGMSYPELNDTPPSLMQNSDYGPIDFTPDQPLISPTGPQRGSVSYPESNPFDPSLVQNADYGPVDFQPNQPLINPTGRNRGGMSYPELNETPPSLLQNSDYGPVDFTPDQPLISPTGPNRGSVGYPEMADTPPSLVPNSMAASDQFAKSVMAPTGEMRGGMSFPETNPFDPALLQNSDYGPIDWTPPEPTLPPAVEWTPPIEADVPTEIINRPTPTPTPTPTPGPEKLIGHDDLMASLRENGIDTPMTREAVEWKPPSTTDDALDLGEISDMDKSMDVDLDKADIINPRGPEYSQRVLKTAGQGKPGFANEGDNLIYRGADGKPVGVAKVKGDTIIDFVISKTGDRATRVAAGKALREEITKRGISKVEGGMTPEAKRVLENIRKRNPSDSFMDQVLSRR